MSDINPDQGEVVTHEWECDCCEETIHVGERAVMGRTHGIVCLRCAEQGA